jgi:hypothetical protein
VPLTLEVPTRTMRSSRCARRATARKGAGEAAARNGETPDDPGHLRLVPGRSSLVLVLAREPGPGRQARPVPEAFTIQNV